MSLDAEVVLVINKLSNSPSQVRRKPSAVLVRSEGEDVAVAANSMLKIMHPRTLPRPRIVPAAIEVH